MSVISYNELVWYCAGGFHPPYPLFHEGRAQRAHFNSKTRSKGVRGISSPYEDLFTPIFINNPSMVFCASRLLYGDIDFHNLKAWSNVLFFAYSISRDELLPSLYTVLAFWANDSWWTVEITILGVKFLDILPHKSFFSCCPPHEDLGAERLFILKNRPCSIRRIHFEL